MILQRIVQSFFFFIKLNILKIYLFNFILITSFEFLFNKESDADREGKDIYNKSEGASRWKYEKKKKSSNKTEECVGEIRTESTKKKGSHTCRTGVPSKTGFSFSFCSNIHIYYSAGYKFRRLRVLRSNVCLRIYIQDNGRIESFLDKSDGNRSEYMNKIKRTINRENE